jgi:hypothetical protein
VAALEAELNHTIQGRPADASPDGRALAWVSTDAGQPSLFDVPRFRPHFASPDGGFEPIRSRSGTELFYRKGRFFAVPIGTKGGITLAGRCSR